MYKDREKQKEAARERKRRQRDKGVTLATEGVTNFPGLIPRASKGVTKESVMPQGVTYPDIIDKLTDPVWRPKLEKICNAFQSSHHPSYSKDVRLGDTNLSTVCDWLECTG